MSKIDRSKFKLTNRQLYSMAVGGSILSIDLMFDAFLLYIEDSKEMIHQANINLKEKFEDFKNIQHNYPEDIDAYDLLENEVLAIKEYDNIFYNSTFIAIYSRFEQALISICRSCHLYEPSHRLPNRPKDLIKSYKKYLTKDLGFDFNNHNKDWEQITKYQKLRNKITHSGNLILDPDEELILVNFIKSNKNIHYKESEDVRIGQFEIHSYLFLYDFIMLIKRYLENILKDITNQIQTKNI